MKSARLSKEEALSFLLTHIVVERNHPFEMNQANLFTMMNMAAEAERRVAQVEGAIPHEIVEEIATGFLETDS